MMLCAERVCIDKASELCYQKQMVRPRNNACRLGFLTLVLLIARSGTSQANGRIPAANQIVVSPQNPNDILLRTTFGVLFSRDRGLNWDWICEKGIGISGAQDPSFAFTNDGSLFGASAEGLLLSTDALCNFQTPQTIQALSYLVDLTLDPHDPVTVLGLASQYERTIDAGLFSFQSQIVRASKNSLTLVGPRLDDSIVFETIEVAASDPNRIYLSGVRSGPSAGAVVLVSRDSGQSFTETRVALQQNERAVFVSGVDGKNADILYVRTAGTSDQPGRLLESQDGGASFRVLFQGKGPLLGFAQSADRIYIGGPVDGLHTALVRDPTFVKTSAAQVQCLTVSADTLWICSNEVTGFIAASSRDHGTTIEPKLKFAGIRGPLMNCGSQATSAQCQNEWPALKRELGIPTAEMDAGKGGPGSPNGRTEVRATGGGCSTSPTQTGMFGALLAALAAAFLKRATK
jgi:hypothetical protein